MDTPPSINAAIDALWVKFLPQIEERLTALETANRALASGKLTDTERAEANTAAHKLAGSLGTFGLTKGTVLAREAEMIYSGELETDPDAASRLEEIASQLKEIVLSRK